MLKETKALILAMTLGLAGTVAAAEEPIVYVVRQGDTLWGISERFVRDPWYWPRMWEVNSGKITNPHFIYPGQRLRIYHDRIVVETPDAATVTSPAPATAPPSAEKVAKPSADEVAVERLFTVSGAEGIIAPPDMRFSGTVSSIAHRRTIAGEDDIVYVDVGARDGVRPGDRFRVFAKSREVRHPVTNHLLGVKLLQLGTLQLTEVEQSSSKAIITGSFREIEVGTVLLPYRETRREVAIRLPTSDLAGMIVDTQSGNRTIAAGDVCYLDLGAARGVSVGNMLYVVRDVEIDSSLAASTRGKLPVDVIGAVLVVDVGEKTSTALVIKSVDTIYLGDRVEFKAL